MKVYFYKGWKLHRIEGVVIQWQRSFFGNWQALVKISKSTHDGYKVNEFVDVWAVELHGFENEKS